MDNRSAPRSSAGYASAVFDPSTGIVHASGEFDLATSSILCAALRVGIEAGPPVLVVDLSGVRFLDASTIRVLLTA
jgi:anti-anti-sigma factor